MGNDFYVYLHLDTHNNKVFYVGKGTSRRAWQTSGRNPKWLKVVENCPNYQVFIIEKNLPEDVALGLEYFWFKFFKPFNLTNKNSFCGKAKEVNEIFSKFWFKKYDEFIKKNQIISQYKLNYIQENLEVINFSDLI